MQRLVDRQHLTNISAMVFLKSLYDIASQAINMYVVFSWKDIA